FNYYSGNAVTNNGNSALLNENLLKGFSFMINATQLKTSQNIYLFSKKKEKEELHRTHLLPNVDVLLLAVHVSLLASIEKGKRKNLWDKNPGEMAVIFIKPIKGEKVGFHSTIIFRDIMQIHSFLYFMTTNESYNLELI
ncbi:hypothetical protein ACJX0J_008721, partial [Zea mays]